MYMGMANGRKVRPSGNRAKQDSKTLNQVSLIKIVHIKVQEQFIIYHTYKNIHININYKNI